jgi:polyphosphate kinase
MNSNQQENNQISPNQQESLQTAIQPPFTFFNREMSWLAFNHRVLQEAMDTSVPVYERIKFLAIYSNNLGEFFRVRVASVRGLSVLKKKIKKKKLDFKPKQLLKKIHKTIQKHRIEYNIIFQNLKDELKNHSIFLVNETELDVLQKEIIYEYFHREVMPLLNPTFLQDDVGPVFLQNDTIYLATRFKDNEGDFVYSLIEIPSNTLSRFFVFPKKDDKNYIIMLDDIIRLYIEELFPKTNIEEVYSVKITRDGELHIYDEYVGNLVDKIKKSLVKRSMGVPSRFLYDSRMPEDFLKYLRKVLALSEDDLVEGGRYQNFKDFMSFPNPISPKLEYKPLYPQKIDELEKYPSILEALKAKDWIFQYPYQDYEYFDRFLWEAAYDPLVSKIRITLYRVANNSKTVNALIAAARNGKEVNVFIEVKARFDEENNLYWSNELLKAGAKVLYSLPGIKVHSKICMISRREGETQVRYGFFSTGNFNEKTSKLYGDIALLTKDQTLTEDLVNLFEFLRRKTDKIESKELLIAPANMRERFLDLMNFEIEQAKQGKPASILLKMNSLEDKDMISKLYEANNAGVKINLIIRGICCVETGVEGQSENIEAISIVDRFLEHARIFVFHHAGEQLVYASSADWMTRNLNYRVEVAFPIKDAHLKQEVLDTLQLQLQDNQKARILNRQQNNRYVTLKRGTPKIRSQYKIYDYCKKKNASNKDGIEDTVV